RDLQHFAMMVGGGAALAIGGAWLADALQHMLSQALRFDVHTVAQTGFMGQRLSQLTGTFLMLMLPLCGLLFAAGVAGALASGGWNWTMKPLMPRFDRLNPISGLGNLVSGQGLGQALKAVALALVLGIVGALVLKDRMAAYVGIMSVPLPAA